MMLGFPRSIRWLGLAFVAVLVAGSLQAGTVQAQTGADACPAGEVMIGGSCHALGKKVAPPTVVDEPAQTAGDDCAPGEVMIGGACRVLGKKVAPPIVVDEPTQTAGDDCAPGEVMIGGACRVLGKKIVPPTVDDPAQTAGDNCSPGEVLIGGACRVMRKKTTELPTFEDEPTDDPEQVPDFGEPVMSWNYTPSVAFGADESVATLNYGLPETDNVQFSASCSSLAGASQPRVIISADVSAVAAGAPILIRFKGSRFDRLFIGTALQTSEQQGIEFDVETDDPLWDALAQQQTIDYSVDANPRQDLGLPGIEEPLGNFLADCAGLAESDPASEIVTDATQLFLVEPARRKSAAELFAGDEFSCEELADRRSTDGGFPTEVTFVNQSGEYRVLDWIDFDGMPVQYAALEDGQSYTVGTNSLHPWMVTDGPGNCIERFMPDRPEIVISRKSPGFGNE